MPVTQDAKASRYLKRPSSDQPSSHIQQSKKKTIFLGETQRLDSSLEEAVKNWKG
jgi:hypothetical protein